jgi:probable H4MPT-linked C1 transfer pathway protein
MKRVLGLDVGGANLKAAHVDGTARSRPFPLWKKPRELRRALRDLLRELPAFEQLALTMTGELCDCFETSRQGVLAILDATEAAVGTLPVRVWHAAGRLTDPAAVRRAPLGAAAVNWLALATLAGRFAGRGPALLIDIGSTTTDIIPLSSGRPVPRGRSDRERLRFGELVYTGARRTPVCALLPGVVAAELFATTLDVYLALGELPEDEGTDTADGRSASRPRAHARLARMLCGDAETCPEGRTRRLAQRAAAAQQRLLCRAVRRAVSPLEGPPRVVILAGSGEFLARKALDHGSSPAPRVSSRAARLGPALSEAACAYAVAVLAAEGKHDQAH